jgi:acyl-CoA synthetase (AMP-forming)/AMP-acid ligase II
VIFHSPHPDIDIPEGPYDALILAQAAARGDRAAFVDGASGRALSFAQVAEGVQRVAAALARRGFGRGDVLAVVLPNLPEYALVFHGVLRAGGVVTTANPLYTAEELAHQLGLTRACFVVTIPSCVDKVRAAAQGTAVREVFVVGDAAGATPFDELLRDAGPPPEVRIDPARDLAVLPFSSGTSGRPKAVMLTHRNLVAITRQVEGAGLSSFDENARALAVLPFFHIYGMVALMSFPLYRGACCVTLPRFELENFLQVAQDQRATHLYLVPPIVLALAKHPLVDRYDLSSVRRINSGAAPLDAGVQLAVAARLRTGVSQGYGMTETSLAISITADGELQPREGASGRLLPNMQARIVDAASGALLGPGQDGEIVVRGPNVMQGYLDDPASTAACLDDEGWLRTGDIGHIDAEGYVYVVDRVKELIKYKGMQVAPSELEGVLLAHPAVADAAVIPSPDEEAGEIPKAFIVLKGEADAAALMAWVAQRVAPHKRIRLLEIVPQIPKSPSGKILRRLLVEQERARVRAQPSPGGVVSL